MLGKMTDEDIQYECDIQRTQHCSIGKVWVKILLGNVSG